MSLTRRIAAVAVLLVVAVASGTTGFLLHSGGNIAAGTAQTATVATSVAATASSPTAIGVCGQLASLGALYSAALTAQAAGQFPTMLSCLTRIEMTDPNYKDTLFALGWALWNTGQSNAAIAAYRAYLKTHPTNGQAYVNLGYSLIKAGRCKEAIPPLIAALGLWPSNPAPAHNLVVCGDMKDVYAAALRAQYAGAYTYDLTMLNQIVATHPNFMDALFARAWALWNTGQREAAISEYRQYLKSHGRNAQAQLDLGYSLIVVRRCGEAIAPLQKTLKLQPGNAAARSNLSMCNSGQINLQPGGAAGPAF
jgi:Flp pilus assembly protein TadD